MKPRLISQLLAFALPCLLQAQEPAPERGTVRFVPKDDQKDVPTRYRLGAHEFQWEMTPQRTLPVSGVEIFEVRFPSPVETKHVENNTVHAEYYRPKNGAKCPGVIVLDITGGDQTLSRVIARHLAQNGIAGMFVQMAYYGPRRPAGSKLRLMSTDICHTLDAVRQTVLDLRRAAAWMESRPELDRDRLGIMGTSLGSFMAALTSEMEPKLGRCAVLLGGGGFVDAYYDHPLARKHRDAWEAWGGTKDMIKYVVAPVDPLTCAANLKNRKLLIVGAKKDEVVPPVMAENLWKASGEQRIIWLDAGHYSAVIFFTSGLKNLVDHFKEK